MIIIGGLRAGGSGKTAFTIELVNQLEKLGIKTAVLCYWLNGYKKGTIIRPAQTDWRSCSDESILIKSSAPADVYVTRDRFSAWKILDKEYGYDVIVSDDGAQDPKIKYANRVFLIRKGERPGISDLIPAGPYRRTVSALNTADLVIEGPLQYFPAVLPSNNFCFVRSLVFPADFDFAREYTVMCALGNNQAFLRDLENAGIKVKNTYFRRDHQIFSSNFIRRISARHNMPILLTAKDYVKINPSISSIKNSRLIIIQEKVTFGKGLFAELLKMAELDKQATF